jgi:hypothetical protein
MLRFCWDERVHISNPEYNWYGPKVQCLLSGPVTMFRIDFWATLSMHQMVVLRSVCILYSNRVPRSTPEGVQCSCCTSQLKNARTPNVNGLHVHKFFWQPRDPIDSRRSITLFYYVHIANAIRSQSLGVTYSGLELGEAWEKKVNKWKYDWGIIYGQDGLVHDDKENFWQ